MLRCLSYGPPTPRAMTPCQFFSKVCTNLPHRYNLFFSSDHTTREANVNLSITSCSNLEVFETRTRTADSDVMTPPSRTPQAENLPLVQCHPEVSHPSCRVPSMTTSHGHTDSRRGSDPVLLLGPSPHPCVRSRELTARN